MVHYTSAGAVKDSHGADPQDCTASAPATRKSAKRYRAKSRPCLNYHIHQCDAPCQGYISKEEYQESVKAGTGLF